MRYGAEIRCGQDRSEVRARGHIARDLPQARAQSTRPGSEYSSTVLPSDFLKVLQEASHQFPQRSRCAGKDFLQHKKVRRRRDEDPGSGYVSVPLDRSGHPTRKEACWAKGTRYPLERGHSF